MTKVKSRKKAGRLAFEANIMDGLAAPMMLLNEKRSYHKSVALVTKKRNGKRV